MSSEWAPRRLGDSCLKIGSGATPKGGKDAYLSHGPYTLIRSQNVYNDGFSPQGLAYIDELQAQKLDGVAVVDDDVLLNITGDSVARVCQAPAQYLPARVNQHVAIIRPIPTIFDSGFLRYFLASPIQQNLMLSLSAVGATRNALTKGMIEDFWVPCPPIEIQAGISGALRALDDRITLLRETNVTLEAIAQAVFKSWFVDFDPVCAKMKGRVPEGMDEATAALFPDGFEESELGALPRGWLVKTLSDAFEVNPKRTLKKASMAPYLDMASLATSGHCVESPVLREMGSGTKFCNGDTLLARITPCLENGKSAFVDFLGESQIGWGSTEFVVLRPKAPLPEYFGYLLCRHQPFRDYAINTMSGTSGRQRIQNDVVARYLLAIPDVAVASAFGEIIEPIQRSIAGNHRTAHTLASLRDTLLPRLISGQLRLPDIETEIDVIAA